MSEPEKFLQRWSRRKQEAEREVKQAGKKPETEARAENEREAAAGARVRPEEKGEARFDPKTLPPIDSIEATTDIRAFLAPGVPEELKRAALQRVWRTDPAIRNFVGLSENSWDFNDPAGAHGFGPLQVTEQLKAAVDAMLDRKSAQPGPEPAGKKTSDVSPPKRVAELAPPKIGDEITDELSSDALEEDAVVENVASQKVSTSGKKSNNRVARRGHGAALPK
jgi:hypothetical protein